MRSTFLGFEVAKRALNASQKGLDVVGQNIANVNTEGYSRQQVNLSAISYDTGSTLIADSVYLSGGQGVNIDSITQLRDKFLDTKFRKENASTEAWNTSLAGLKDLESVIDEVRTDGLGSALSDFYTKLQNYSSNTSSAESASLLRSAAQKLTGIINQYAQKFENIKEQQSAELSITIDDSNAYLVKIKEVNSKIKSVIAAGGNPNELLDMRNTYLDKLSANLGITVEAQTDGTVAVKSGSTYLIDANQTINTLSLASGEPVSIQTQDGTTFSPTGGKVYGYLQLLDGKGSFAVSGENEFRGIPYYESALDAFALKFAETLNNLNEESGTAKPLFTGDGTTITASNITISKEWINNVNFITNTTGTAGAAKNDNILRMINALNDDQSLSGSFSGTFEEYVTSLNGDIAMDVSFFTDMAESSSTTLAAVTDERDSVSGVSLDEESVNMIKFQKAYSAAARVMTTLDEMIDIIINKMGVVGR